MIFSFKCNSFLTTLFIFLLFQFTNAQKMFIYIGSYTDDLKGKGIYVYEFNEGTGELLKIQVIDSIVNPSFLKLNAGGDLLFTVSESQLQVPGKIASFSRDATSGKLSFISTVNSEGRNPVHLSLNKEEDYLVNANYTDPSITLYPITGHGILNSSVQKISFTKPGSGVVTDRQGQAHIHSSDFTPDENYLLVQDLGSDKIYSFQFDKNDQTPLKMLKSAQFDAKPGAGPRHFTFHPNGRYAYGVAELNGMVSVFTYNEGRLNFQSDILSYQKKQDLYRTADIHCSFDGKFLYVSNRGPKEDSITIFEIDQKDGDLKVVGREPTYGEHPRNFAVSKSGKFVIVANQFSNNVVLFKRDAQTGLLARLPYEINVHAPSSVQIFEAE